MSTRTLNPVEKNQVAEHEACGKAKAALTDIKSDLAQLKIDVVAAVQDAMNCARDRVDCAEAKVVGKYQSTCAAGTEIIKKLEAAIVRRPLTSLAVAACAGMIAGRIFRNR